MRTVITMKQLEYQNSRIEIYLGVIRNLLDDIAALIGSCETLRVRDYLRPVHECDRDFKYISSRVKSEGLGFLTMTLPRLGKWYDSVISENNGPHPEGFKPYTNLPSVEVFQQIGGCPLFCRMLAYVILDSRGSLLERARILRAYRSLFFLYYKLETPLTDEQETAALVLWRRNEEELEYFELPDYYDADLIRSRQLLAELMCDGVRVFTDINPRHGPGAVAGGESNEMKWEKFRYIPSLHNVYPEQWFFSGATSAGSLPHRMWSMVFRNLPEPARATSKLLFVPKDSRGPRTISCEPKELMFIQQGVARNLMRVLYARSHGRINFLDQKVNGTLALTSSETGELATIDLKDASDRVSTKLVLALFPEWAHRYLLALRSDSTLLPDGSLFEGHRKYAPMGSALCFPVESAIFWALAVSAGIESGLTEADAKATTYVYGDDIIIRPQVFTSLKRIFSKFALIVNVEKSYVVGPFRESCGVDAWKGYNVTPLKIKKDIGHRSLSGDLATAICEYSSTCFALDYRKTGERLFNLVNQRYPGVIRYYRGPFGCLHVVDPLAFSGLDQVRSGWSSDQCKVWVEGWVPQVPSEPSHLDGLSRLLKNLFGSWELHDPGKVADSRSAKIRKRKTLVEGGIPV